MANYQLLKADIDEKVYVNGEQKITGENLNSVLTAMVTTLGAGYQFAGVATTATNPGTPDAKVFYIANGKGTYTNFSGLEVTEDEVVVLYWDTAWHKVATGIASQEELTELAEKVNGKQDALTLTVKDNGNIIIANIQGQSKEFMPATPSGDPMHYAYVAAGAEYNDTGADIVKTTPWADLADDDADKTVVHKAGYWYLNGLGDITTDEIREIYSWIGYTRVTYGYSIHGHFMDFPLRTNFYFESRKPSIGINASFFLRGSKLVVAGIGDLRFIDYGQFLYSNAFTKHILGHLNFAGKMDINCFSLARELKTIKVVELKYDFRIPQSPNISSKSILYMINNEAATSAITITLHPDAYARAMADAEILAALETHTNISLASA